MASIQTAIRLNDQMTAPIHHITSAMNMMLSSWTSLDNATSGGLDVGDINSIRDELYQASLSADQLRDSQESFNNQVQEGSTAVSGLTKKIIGAVGAYAGLQSIKELVSLSDTYTQTMSRLNMIADDGDANVLYDKIYASAQRARAPVKDMTDMVAKLSLNAGDAFTSNDEAILFAENLNKIFAIGGTEQASIASASLQLTQALGSGVLRGEEFNAVFEAAPMVMQTLADYMGVPVGSLKEMASEGQITAETVKNALINATTTDSINQQFEKMDMTWGQVLTNLGNKINYVSQPLFKFINWLANNLEIIIPLVLGLGTAFTVFQIAAHWTAIATAVTTAYHAVVNFLSIGFGMLTGSTVAASAATFTYNSALLASPITWYLMAIIAVVAAIYAVVAVINKVTGSTISATGIITGAVYALFSYLWNIVAAFVNYFANVWNDPIGSIARLFGDLADNILGILELIAKGIDKVFGSHLQDTISGWRSGLSGLIEGKFGSGTEVMAKMDTMDAFNKGYDFGVGLENKIGDFFGGATDQYDLDAITNGVNSIAGNTDTISDSLDITDEDLKYMRDLAEQETINRFTTAEVKVDLGGVTNNVNNNTDLDGVVDYLTTGVQEAMERIAEGVH